MGGGLLVSLLLLSLSHGYVFDYDTAAVDVVLDAELVIQAAAVVVVCTYDV